MAKWEVSLGGRGQVCVGVEDSGRTELNPVLLVLQSQQLVW